MKEETAEQKIEESPKFRRSRGGILPLAYLVHLVVPALLLADIATSYFGHKVLQAKSVGAVAAVSVVWLVGGLVLFFASGDRRAFLKRIQSPLTAVYAIYLALFLMEGCVRLMGFNTPIRGEAFSRRMITADPNILPGVSGTKWYTINALGLRGPMPPIGNSTYKIMAIGASTTICSDLDDSEEWPHLVMQTLNAAQRAQPVWVGNSGVAGDNTVNHLVLMQWFPGTLHTDMAIFLIGVNDLTATLAYEGAPTQKVLEQAANFEGNLPVGTHWRSLEYYPRYRRARLLALVRLVKKNLQQRLHPPTNRTTQPGVVALRQQRSAAPVVPLPDLSVGLREYAARVGSLADRCRDLKMRCLFLTQPSMWRTNQTARENALFWQGYLGRFVNPKGYLSPPDMAQAMDRYNRTLLDVCRQRGLECFDIAALIPKDTSAFYDEMHFNENGARLVSKNLKEYLLAKPPFNAKKG
jgi:lysophospholipase L1-like esterase